MLNNRTPEPILATSDLHHDFVLMQDIADCCLSATQIPCALRAELQNPSPDHFVGDLDPALHDQLFDFPKSQIKARVQPNRVGDDLWRESVVNRPLFAGDPEIRILGYGKEQMWE